MVGSELKLGEFSWLHAGEINPKFTITPNLKIKGPP